VDPSIAGQLILAWDLWLLGYPAQAHDNVFQALALATERAEPYTVAFAQYVTSAVQLLRGQNQDALTYADRSLAVSREHGVNLYELYSRFGRGCALAKMGQQEEAILEMQAAIVEARRSQLGHLRGFMLASLAAVQADAGDPKTALATVEGALQQISDVSGRAWEAELRRVRSNVLLAAHPEAAEEAERGYREAIAVAKTQQARSLQLRATTSLARLLLGQARTAEARAQLAETFGWFTEGFDTADLTAAKELLARLN
jgi:ATP/maltotriose-dependent transcriptional regulator MalT